MATNRTYSKARQKLRKRLERNGVAPDEIDRLVEAKRLEQLASTTGPTPPAAAGSPAPVVESPYRVPKSRTRSWSTSGLAAFDAHEARRLELERLEAAAPAPVTAPDDRGFKPTAPDPLLTGPGRATGIAAKAVRRRSKAVTRYEYDQLEREQA